MGYGITIPFEGVPLNEHREWLAELSELGYSDVWSAEADGTDGFTPLALAAAWAPSLRLGTAIVPVFTRGPALLAQSAAALAEAAPGRFVLGVGTSSDVIVERWNGIPFEDPYGRARDTLRFLRRALSGEKVSADYPTLRVDGFRLARPPQQPPRILLAALRPGMLRLGSREADGVITNWLSASDVPKVVAEVGPGREVVARIFVIPSEDAAAARGVARRLIAAYLNVPVYAAFQEWLGRGPLLQDMWQAWSSGDRRGALEAIPDEVVDALVLHGSPQQLRRAVARYADSGVTTPVLLVMGGGQSLRRAVRDLAPG